MKIKDKAIDNRDQRLKSSTIKIKDKIINGRE